MSPLLEYFWPAFALALLCGAVATALWLRRKNRKYLYLGAAVALAGAALWHGPLGAADRFTQRVERTAHTVLVDWEMGAVEAHLHRGPLSRRLMLSGPADDFQRTELVHLMSLTPGVSRATWSRSGGIPMLIEALLVAAAGFLIGLSLAYVVELRRRYNAQWKW